MLAGINPPLPRPWRCVPAKSKLDMAPAMSSRVNVLNSRDVNSASSSSGEVGTYVVK